MSPPCVRVLTRSVGGSRHALSPPIPAGRGSRALPRMCILALPCCAETPPPPLAQLFQLLVDASWSPASEAVSGGGAGPRVEEGAAVGVVGTALLHRGRLHKMRDQLHEVFNAVHANDGHGRPGVSISIRPANLDPVAAKGVFVRSARDVVVQHESAVHGFPVDRGAEEGQQPAVCAVLEEDAVIPALAKDLATTASNTGRADRR